MLYDGKKWDTTNFSTDKYLQINSCGYQNAASHFSLIRKNGRCDYHILLISEGRCTALHGGKYHSLVKGNLIIYSPGEEQQYSFEAGTSTLWCHFDGTIMQELFRECGIKSGVLLFRPNDRIFNAFSGVIRSFHNPTMEKFAKSFLFELLYCLSEGMTMAENDKNQDIIQPILSYINISYNKKITLEELAKKAGYSKSRFSHIFSSVTGTTPIKYQNEIRLKTACELLSATLLSITDISISCGFEDPLYFSRLFKRKYGISPTEFRRTAVEQSI